MVTLISFGFKHGKPDADLVYDIRREVKNQYVKWGRKTGCHPDVTGDVWKEAKQYLYKIAGQIVYLSKSRPNLCVAVGCIGGKHRSVAAVEMLGYVLKGYSIPHLTIHRDIGK